MRACAKRTGLLNCVVGNLSRIGVIAMNDKNRDPMEEIVGTVAFSMPELQGHSDRAAVLLHIKVDTGDFCTQTDVLKWLMDAVSRAGGELHVELCGPGDTTSPT